MPIKVLQWNIWYKEDIENIALFLEKNTADIICLQELMHNYSGQKQSDTAKYLASRLAYEYQEQIVYKDPEGWQQGNAIFTKHRLVSTKSSWIQKRQAANGYENEPRGYLEATIKIKNISFTVATTHMSFTDNFKVTDNKKAETDKLISLIKHNKNNNYILTGDLNALPDSYTVGEISKYLLPADPPFSQPTWTTKPFNYQGMSTDSLDKRIDYIFASKRLKVTSSKILQTSFSDHLPILTTFEV